MVRVTVPCYERQYGLGAMTASALRSRLYNVIDLAENDHIDISDKKTVSICPAGREQPDLIGVQSASTTSAAKPLSGLDHR